MRCTITNHTNWDDVRSRRGEVPDEERAEIEADLALAQLIYGLLTKTDTVQPAIFQPDEGGGLERGGRV